MAGSLDGAPILCVGIAHISYDSFHYVHIEIIAIELKSDSAIISGSWQKTIYMLQ